MTRAEHAAREYAQKLARCPFIDIRKGDTITTFNGTVGTAMGVPVMGCLEYMVSFRAAGYWGGLQLRAIVEVKRNGVVVYPSAQLSLWE